MGDKGSLKSPMGPGDKKGNCKGSDMPRYLLLFLLDWSCSILNKPSIQSGGASRAQLLKIEQKRRGGMGRIANHWNLFAQQL